MSGGIFVRFLRTVMWFSYLLQNFALASHSTDKTARRTAAPRSIFGLRSRDPLPPDT